VVAVSVEDVVAPPSAVQFAPEPRRKWICPARNDGVGATDRDSLDFLDLVPIGCAEDVDAVAAADEFRRESFHVTLDTSNLRRVVGRDEGDPHVLRLPDRPFAYACWLSLVQLRGSFARRCVAQSP
jgi:hypothetical protein